MPVVVLLVECRIFTIDADLSSWNNIMSYFIFLDIRPFRLPSPKERVIELRVDKVLYKIRGHYLLSIT